MRTFKSSLDKSAKITSVLVILLSVCLSIFPYFTGLPNETAALICITLISPLIFGIVFVVTYMLHPLGITVYSTELTIDRKLKPVTLNYQEIQRIGLVPFSDMKGTIRTMGNGGLWGYTGKFYNKKMGIMTFYCTQQRKYVVIELKNNKKVIVSPDEPDEFVAEIKRQRPPFTIDT